MDWIKMEQCMGKNICEIVEESCVDFTEFSGTSLLITGATGLIGVNLVRILLAAAGRCGMDITIVILVRNLEKAKRIFGKDLDRLIVVVGDVTEMPSIQVPLDYIVHAASQTASKAFVEDPVGVIRVALKGTENLLNLAREKKVRGFVYTSSMEVYGAPTDDEKIKESNGANLDTMAVRSSYPEGKRMCEALCCAYAAQYHVPAKVIRLTQTFGPGVEYHDGRVFAEFARCAIEEKNIELHTIGDTKRNYLYTADAVTAILTVLLKGEPGEAYNAANENTYCSIYEMAQFVAKEFGRNKIQVTRKIADDICTFGYAPTLHMNLDCSKLAGLGWKPKYDLKDCYSGLITGWQKEDRQHEENHDF